MKKRLFSFVIATVMVATIFVGCGKENNSKNENVTPTKTEETEKAEEPTAGVSETAGNYGEASESSVNINENKVDMIDIPIVVKDGNGEFEDTGDVWGKYYIDNNTIYMEEPGPLENYYYSIKLPQYTDIIVLYDEELGMIQIVMYIDNKDNKCITIYAGNHNFNCDAKLSEATQEEIKTAFPSNNIFVYNTNDNIETLTYDITREISYGMILHINENKDFYYKFEIYTFYDTNNELMYSAEELLNVAENITIIKDEDILKNFK